MTLSLFLLQTNSEIICTHRVALDFCNLTIAQCCLVSFHDIFFSLIAHYHNISSILVEGHLTNKLRSQSSCLQKMFCKNVHHKSRFLTNLLEKHEFHCLPQSIKINRRGIHVRFWQLFHTSKLINHFRLLKLYCLIYK